MITCRKKSFLIISIIISFRSIQQLQGVRTNDIEIDAIYQHAGLLRIDFKEPLEPSTIYQLKISYRGKIRSLPYGLFYMIDRNPDTLQEK